MARLIPLFKAIQGERCPACGQAFFKPSNKLGLCPSCSSELRLRTKGYCPLCAELYPKADEDPYLCSTCRNNSRAWDSFGFFNVYEGLLKQCLLSLKFGQDLGQIHLLRKLLLQAFEYHYTELEPDLILPVPVHNNRLKSRGFNQALEIARGLEAVPGFRVNRDLLKKVKDTLPQSGLDKEGRKNNLKDAFVVRESLQDKDLLLVDDICTTGYTLQACSRVLKQAGARSVHVLVLARGGKN